jgi:hypothetical protein
LIAKFINVGRQILVFRHLPLVLALLAAISMLPALKIDLFGDDLVQRLAQFKSTDLPPHAVDTGFVPPNSGELGSVASHLFSYLGRQDSISSARNWHRAVVDTFPLGSRSLAAIYRLHALGRLSLISLFSLSDARA